MSLKRFRIDTYEFIMLGIVVATSLFRLVLIANNWPSTNSDEAIMGLIARHMVYKGEYSIFFYGQNYMGTIQPTLGALFFHIFGPSLFSLRIGMILLFAAFLVSLYALISLIYTKKFALICIALLSIGSKDVFIRELKVVGGYIETLLFGALIFFIVSWLALSAQPSEQIISSAQRRKRFCAYGLLGLTAGLALWSDSLILICLVSAGVFLLFFCYKEILSRAPLFLLLGGIIGGLPLIIYNLTAPFNENSLQVLLKLQKAGADQIIANHLSFVNQLIGTFLIALPTMMGATPQCSGNPPYYGLTRHCIAFQGGWSLGYCILWGLATLLALSFLWQHRQGIWKHKQTFEERQMTIRQSARLMLLATAALTLFSYITSPSSALTPAPTARYLICLLLTVPAILWPLWNGMSTFPTRFYKSNISALAIKSTLLILIAITLLQGTFATIIDIPAAHDSYNKHTALIQYLESIGAKRVYSVYWTCNVLSFQSNEQVICGVVGDNLRAGINRYPAYYPLVQAISKPIYVFLPSPSNIENATPEVATLEHDLHTYKIPYQRYVIDGYTIYQLARPLPLS